MRWARHKYYAKAGEYQISINNVMGVTKYAPFYKSKQIGKPTDDKDKAKRICEKHASMASRLRAEDG